MQLPNRDKVVIPRDKLIKYLLSDTHALGRFKARYFGSIGFNKTNVGEFENILRDIAETEKIKDTIKSKYGIKYIIDGRFASPNGKNVKLRTIWIIEKGKTNPRFVTTYPV